MNNLNKLVTNYPVTLTPEEVKNLSMTLSAVKTASGTGGKIYNGDNTYIGVDNTNNTIRFLNDAINKLESVSSKLNISAFSEVSGDFLTQEDLNDYATKTDLEGYQEKGNYLSANALDEISGTWENVTAKLDTTAFSAVSGNFLTEHQSLANYYQKTETSGVSELNSAFESKQNTLSAGQNITIVNNVIDLKNIDCSASTNSIALGIKTSALGDYSVAIGYQSVAEGDISFVQGYGTNAIGNNAAAFGVQSVAKGTYSLAEGNKTSAVGAGSHAEGDRTLANYQFSHAEGVQTTANSQASHTEGAWTIAGDYSHAEGQHASAVGQTNHAEGYYSLANGQFSHAEGYQTSAIGMSNHSEGQFTYAGASFSHAEGQFTSAKNSFAHAEGQYTLANAVFTHAEGCGTSAKGDCSHAGGQYTVANYGSETVIGQYNISTYSDDILPSSGKPLFVVGNGASNDNRSDAFIVTKDGIASATVLATSGISDIETYVKQNTLTAGTNLEIVNGVIGVRTSACTANNAEYAFVEGISNKATGKGSHAEGDCTVAFGRASHAEGSYTTAYGSYSHTEGQLINAYGDGSHAEGFSTKTQADYSHSEGYNTLATGEYSHAEGEDTEANGEGSHAEGFLTKTQGNYSHSEGYATSAIGFATHAGGLQTRANYQYETVIGKFNISSYDDSILPESAKPLFAVGNGSADNSRSDAFIVTLNGIASATTLATSGISNIETKINDKQDNLTQEQLSAISSVSSIKDYVNSSFLPLSGGTVSGELVVSGGGNFDTQFLKITRENVNGYGRIGLGSSGPLALKVDDANQHTTQVNISPNTTNDQLVQIQHNGTTVGNLIPVVTATTTAGLTNDGILHIILES